MADEHASFLVKGSLIIHHLSIFSFKKLNFVSSPKILKEVLVKSYEEKSLTEESVSVELVDSRI